MPAGDRVETLTFRLKYNYAASKTGVEVPVTLRVVGARAVRLLAKVDTGASFCIFQREHAEELGIDVERGVPDFSRNVVGRLGWLQYFRLGLIDHDTALFLSHYED